MTTNIPRRGLSPSKSGPTPLNPRTSGSSQNFQQSVRAASRAAHRKSAPDTESNDASSDKNTVVLIRRVLCPESTSYGSNTPQPLQDLLPPLTSSNDIDLQLYALIAIIIREFVYSWYAKITPDHVFVDEVLQLIAHCTRALEQRLRQVDIKQLALDELPGLVEAHIIAYRTAKQGSNLVCIPSSTRDIYHHLNPHPSLSPPPDALNPSSSADQQENERLYRHLLSQGVLAVLLPTEDLENVCLRTLVEDILSDLLLGNEVSGKICEGWFIWMTISKVIELVRRRSANTAKDAAKSNDDNEGLGRLEKFGLLSSDQTEVHMPGEDRSTITLWMWKILYTVYLFYLAARFVIGGLFRTALSPTEPSTRETVSPEQFTPVKSSIQASSSRPVLDYRAFSLVSQWTGLSQRMPWLSGSCSLIQNLVLTGPGKLGETNSVIDRFLRELIDTYILTPAILPTLLLAIRTTLFPSNTRPNTAPIPAPQQSTIHGTGSGTATANVDILTEALSSKQGYPSESEVAAIKRQCAADILSLFPRAVAQAFFCGTATSTMGAGDTTETTETDPVSPTSNNMTNDYNNNNNNNDDDDDDSNDTTALLETIETDLLDPFSDAYCNKHLIFAAVETVLVKLLPELSERGITELMEERGVVSMS